MKNIADTYRPKLKTLKGGQWSSVKVTADEAPLL